MEPLGWSLAEVGPSGVEPGKGVEPGRGGALRGGAWQGVEPDRGGAWKGWSSQEWILAEGGGAWQGWSLTGVESGRGGAWQGLSLALLGQRKLQGWSEAATQQS